MENIESTRGLLFSQRVMLTLVSAGMSRDDAYKLAQGHAATTWDKKADFRDLIKNDSKVTALLDKPTLDELFDYNFYTQCIDALFTRVGLNE